VTWREQQWQQQQTHALLRLGLYVLGCECVHTGEQTRVCVCVCVCVPTPTTIHTHTHPTHVHTGEQKRLNVGKWESETQLHFYTRAPALPNEQGHMHWMEDLLHVRTHTLTRTHTPP